MATETENTTRAEALKKLGELIRGMRVAMLTTVAENGHLRSRPLATQETPLENDEFLWFFTCGQSEKVGEIEHEHQVNLAYAAPDDNRYVSIAGRATVVQDRDKIEELWSPILKAWFPDGVETPGLTLLRVAPAEAEYWDATSSRMVLLAGLIKSVVSGESFRPGENKTIDLA